MKFTAHKNVTMKNILLIFSFVFLLNLNSICQNLPDSSSNWTIAFIEMGSYIFNSTYSIESDTTINKVIYKTIYVTYDSVFNKEQSFYHSAVRESGGKWFFVPKDKTEEYLLYDFNAKIGDTITINNPWTGGERDLIVFETDSVELFDGYHKTFAVGKYDGPSGQPLIIETWIKGIGSPNGLFYSGYFLFDAGYQLLCFHRNDSLIYLNSPDGTCGYILVSIKPQTFKSEIKISPNPVRDILNIDSKDEVYVEIYDVSGIKRIKSNCKSIDISDLETGIYFVRILNSSMQLLKLEKIIKQ
jgi:hypothetical protein